MMAKLLVIRSKLQWFFEKNYRVVRGLLKGLIVLISLMILTSKFSDGYFSERQWMFIPIAIICAVAPDAVSIVAVVLVVGIEVWKISPVLAGALLVLILVFFLLFGRRMKEQWYMLLAVPILSAIQIGFMAPVVAALFLSPTIIPALAMGIILRFSLDGVAEYTTTAQRTTGDIGYFSSWNYLVDYLLQNRLFLVALIVYIITFLVVYMIRRMNIKYSSQIAILVGCVVLYTLEMVSNIIWELELNLLLTSILVVVPMIVAYIIQFFRLSLDYHGTRRLQFEDDEYYYYVTAIPKYSVAAPQTEVTKIVVDEGDAEELLSEEDTESETDNRTE